eukprot:Partr_v1_DN27735_c1_g1_i4_m67044 putative RAB escort protein
MTSERVDIALVGTGLVQSMVAAALACHGVSVLHLDPSPSYGGSTATFTGRELLSWLESPPNSVISNLKVEGDREVLTERGWEIDIGPKLLLSNGPMVDLLVSSGVSRYLEFKLLPHLFLSSFHKRDEWFRMPFSKEDVFVDKSIPLMKKRKLMKIIKCLLDVELDDSVDKQQDLCQYLRAQGLDEESIYVHMYAVCNHQGHVSKFSIPLGQGIAYTKMHVQSVARFGHSPYLIPLYGTGELAQAFSRVAAVYGATQILNPASYSLDGQNLSFTLESSIANEEPRSFKFEPLVSVVSSDFTQSVETSEFAIHHSIAIIDFVLTLSCPQMKERPHNADLPENVFAFIIPPSDANEVATYAVHYSDSTAHAPAGNFILHLWKQGNLSEDPKSALAKDMELILGDIKPLLSISFTRTSHAISHANSSITVPELSEISALFQVEEAVLEARKLFHSLYQTIWELKGNEAGWDKDVEFLPKLPDPEMEQVLIRAMQEEQSSISN